MRLTRRELLLGAAALPSLAAKKPVAPPSVLLIAVEDLGAWMLGCYGNQEIRTPNIDVLARSGTRFLNSYAAAPVAKAGRAALLTGQSPRQLGFAADAAVPPSLESQPMLSDILSGQGYQCGYVGACDFAAKPQHGFQSVDTAADHAAVASKAAQFLDARKAGQPFLLVLSYALNSVVSSKYEKMYAGTSFDTIGWDRPAAKAALNKELLRDTVGNIRKAAAAVTALDDQILPLLRKLDERGLRGETLIVFTGTNGALLGRHGLWGDARASAPPNLYEEVTAVPLLWQWQGHIPPEAVRPEFVGAYDLLPALCELTGTSVPAGRKAPGRSYLPAVLNKPFPKKQPWRSLVFSEFGDAVMVRDKRFKLVLPLGRNTPGELYDEVADPRERVNQHDNPRFVSVRDGLAHEIENWTKSF
jgi:arylsulfatase A-like enzyme